MDKRRQDAPQHNHQRIFVSQSGVETIEGEKPLTGYFTTFIHLVKGYIGTGIFALPRGFKNSGLIFGACFFGVVAVMNLHCQRILIRRAEKISAEEGTGVDVKPTFAETVEYTFESSKIACFRNNSKALATTTNIFLCFCELGFCCVYFNFIATHLRDVAVHYNLLECNKKSYHIVLAIILLPMWASTFLGNLKLILPLSIISNIMLWIVIVTVLYFSLQNGLPHVSERELVTSYKLWPYSFGTMLFAFEGITLIIPLRNEMKQPEKFIKVFGVLNTGIIFVAILYYFVGFIGYWSYGDNVHDSIVRNLSSANKDLSDAMDIIISIGILFTFTLHMYIPIEITFPLFYRKYGPFKHGRLTLALYRTVPVLIMFTLANLVPNLGLFIDIIGCTGGAWVALLMPAALDLIGSEKINVLKIIKNAIIILFALVGSLTGTTLSLMGIIHEFSEKDNSTEC